MAVRKVSLAELSEPVRVFLAQAKAGDIIVVHDQAGQLQYDIISTAKLPSSQESAWQRIQYLQQKVARSMAEEGITEDDVMQAILENN